MNHVYHTTSIAANSLRDSVPINSSEATARSKDVAVRMNNRERHTPVGISVIEGHYLRDLLDQPAALGRTSRSFSGNSSVPSAVATLRNPGRHLLLTGMGGSLYSLYPLYLRLVELGIPTYLVETAELIHYQADLLRSAGAVFVVSQSGRSAEIIRLAERRPPDARLLAVTNDLSAPLAGLADIALQLDAGPEVTVSCKTYVTSLLALDWLSSLLSGTAEAAVAERLYGAGDAVADYLSTWRDHVEWWNRELDGVQKIFLAGRGPSVASAETGGLILKESTRFCAEGMSSAAFRHGPIEAAGPETMVIVFQGLDQTSSLNATLVRDVKLAGCRGILVGPDGSGAAKIAAAGCPMPILEILPVQMLSLALAARQGNEAGRFERATKVTAVE